VNELLARLAEGLFASVVWPNIGESILEGSSSVLEVLIARGGSECGRNVPTKTLAPHETAPHSHSSQAK